MNEDNVGRSDRRSQVEATQIAVILLLGLLSLGSGMAGAVILVYTLTGDWTSGFTVGGGFATAVVMAVGTLIKRRKMR